MILRRSRFIHQLPVGNDRSLIVHAISQMRLPANGEISALLEYFTEPRRIPEDCEAMMALFPDARDKLTNLRDVVERTVLDLLARQILTEKTPEEELATVGAELAPSHGRDPAEILERYRRSLKEGAASSYWAVGASYGLNDFGAGGQPLDVILLGDCDIQMEADFLRREAAQRGIELRVSATFPDDIRFVGERRHDAVFIGALRSRHLVAEDLADGLNPHAAFIAFATQLLTQLRESTSAPILIDNLPEPTVQPMGLAERGLRGHRNRFRTANLALAALAENYADVHVVDIAAILNAAGAERMLDDGLMAYAHFGSPGWLLQRPEQEKQAVFGIFPDVTEFAANLGGDPYLREQLTGA